MILTASLLSATLALTAFAQPAAPQFGVHELKGVAEPLPILKAMDNETLSDCAGYAFTGAASLNTARNLATEDRAKYFLQGLGGESLATEKNAMRLLRLAKSRPTGRVLAGVIAASGAAYIYEWFATPAKMPERAPPSVVAVSSERSWC